MKTVVTYGAVASGAFCTVARLCLPHVPSRAVALQVFQVSLLPWPASSPIWGEMLFWLCSSLTLEGPHGRAVWAGGETIASFDGPFRNEAALSESRLKLSSAQHACSFSQIPFVLPPRQPQIRLLSHDFKPWHLWVSFCLGPFYNLGCSGPFLTQPACSNR